MNGPASFDGYANLDPTGVLFGSPVLFLTEATWKAQSGLTSGFRRATTSYPADWTNYNDPAFSYGTCQPGDIFGPWLIADIRAGLQPLRWTCGYGNYGGNPGCSIDPSYANSCKSVTAVGATWAAAKAAAIAAWPTAALANSPYSDPIGDQNLDIPAWYADVTPTSGSQQRGYWVAWPLAAFAVFKWRFQYHQ